MRAVLTALLMVVVGLVVTATPALGAPKQFVDNGDGTITDRQTGLMWQKTDTAGGLTANTLTRKWDLDALDTSDSSHGSSIFTWLDRLNGRLTNDPSQPGFAGHTDWRIPTVFELETILLIGPCPGSPISCIDPIFGPIGPTVPSFYWSSSSLGFGPEDAWNVSFGGAGVLVFPKSFSFFVRAVRRGL